MFLSILDQFKSWEDFKSKHPESSGLYKSFLSDYLEFEGKQLPRKSKVKEKRR